MTKCMNVFEPKLQKQIQEIRIFYENRERSFLRLAKVLCRGVTHQSITIGFGLRHIRVSHLVLSLHTLEYHTWSRFAHIRPSQFYMYLSVLVLNFTCKNVRV